MKIDDKPASEMTLREHYAGLIMAAMMGDPSRNGELDAYARDASKAADALCRELAKPRPKPAWQPMSTAPVGVKVAVCGPGDWYGHMRLSASGRWQVQRPSEDGPFGRWYDHGTEYGSCEYREPVLFAWREIETDNHPEQLPTEPVT